MLLGTPRHDIFRCVSGNHATHHTQHDDGYRSWSYTSQVGAAARNFSVKLHAEGINKGEKIISWSENRPEWVAAFWGYVLAVKTGGSTSTLGLSSHPEEPFFQLERARSAQEFGECGGYGHSRGRALLSTKQAKLGLG